MSRLQLALDVGDLDAAIDFYRALFGVEPHKVKPGYANFVVADPPLKLVLFESDDGTGARLNHLGVEVDSTEEVDSAGRRLAAAELDLEVEEQTACCYALQDKVWVRDPDGARWEYYVVHEDLDTSDATPVDPGPTACCG